jgi:[histone H3]-lysine36 N-dimethyltransferase NSD2
LNETSQNNANFKCYDCVNNNQMCFSCKQLGTEEEKTFKCLSNNCNRFYHNKCSKLKKEKKENDDDDDDDVDEGGNTFQHKKNGFICPLHCCASCHFEAIDDTSTTTLQTLTTTKQFNGRFFKCFKCPKAYHMSDYCLAAGSHLIGDCYIICPDHFKPNNSISHHKLINVSWCLLCCKSGYLIGCDKCPSAFHYNCLKNPPPLSHFNSDYIKLLTLEQKQQKQQEEEEEEEEKEEKEEEEGDSSVNRIKFKNGIIPSINGWTCDDCSNGFRSLYGSIVWSKVGHYKWWPAQICHPQNLPEKLKKIQYPVGEFAVRFFGSNDYFWTTMRRCFNFVEGDDGHNINNNKKIEKAFNEGIEEAKKTFLKIKAFKYEQKMKENERNMDRGIGGIGSISSIKDKTSKYNFKFIRVNKPVGITVPKIPICELNVCQCDWKEADPCGDDDKCLNRVLKYECHPAMCRAGVRCLNQRFTKRLYPNQKPIKTSERGWGLKAGVDIKKGEFVNEYVGELIDENECKKRLKIAHENNIHNFYFLNIGNDRYLNSFIISIFLVHCLFKRLFY